jgi:hypothetical protein
MGLDEGGYGAGTIVRSRSKYVYASKKQALTDEPSAGNQFSAQSSADQEQERPAHGCSYYMDGLIIQS